MESQSDSARHLQPSILPSLDWQYLVKMVSSKSRWPVDDDDVINKF